MAQQQAEKETRTIPLPAVDSVRVSTIMDNSIDVLMAGSEVAHRWKRGPNPFEREQPIAQHGFSVMIEVSQGPRAAKVLFDTGVSKTGILYNLDALELPANDIQAIILSHGHTDHAMGLLGLLDRLGSRDLPLVLHPEAYLERRLTLPDGSHVYMIPPRRSDLRREHIELIEEVGPSLLVDGMLLVSGEVARQTSFESGYPGHEARRNGAWQPDPLIMDDQCAILNVRDKGLVVVTGCGHAGIINIIRHAQALTGVERIHAVIGGFHLTGALFAQRIPATVAALRDLAPAHIVPGHCTGFPAIHAIANALPEAFIPGSVGTTYWL
jgi:7,8-dihydropterin-6-yl-methyl-4-(beta-D-ribofuranosyl)aminobenzene 5'-phosphate synthase